MEKFKVLGLSESTVNALVKKGFEEPTEIQSLTIPLLENTLASINNMELLNKAISEGEISSFEYNFGMLQYYNSQIEMLELERKLYCVVAEMIF